MDTLDDRAAARLRWTRDMLHEPLLRLAPASGDASFRSYWRGTRGDGHSVIVMDAPPAHEDIRPWLDIAARLRAAGLVAPGVYASDATLGFIAMQDLGSATLLPLLDAHTVDALYATALDALLTMQRDVDCADLPPYDAARLIAEMELLPTWFLQRHLGVELGCADWDTLELAMRRLCNSALAQPRVFVHRDYHSRNLLALPDGGVGVIDFQDAVRGPLTYDLVSLLKDCYIAWPAAQVRRWALDYRTRAVGAGLWPAARDEADFLRAFDLMGLQRHLKVLGIFCRLYYRDGKAQYLADLPRVLAYTLEATRAYAEFAALGDLLERAGAARDLTLPRA
ncbi:aminoglycoside phosphotransferase family protein [Metallibacterium scheffleri]|uniref:aminoglycoside phosphotransferase family protein n=1 Tax=Metallibacterium scheffleri TaxID=993689 RepID=UPI0023F12F66|nr:phosphotransferase [Metallibacterium scheffleri]